HDGHAGHVAWRAASSRRVQREGRSAHQGGAETRTPHEHGLNEAKCVPARVATIRDEKEPKIYEITCIGNDAVGMSCTNPSVRSRLMTMMTQIRERPADDRLHRCRL